VRRTPFVLLQVGNLLSGAGNGVAMVVLPWLILEITGSASAAGLVAALTAHVGSLKGVRILWPRSDVARRELPAALVAAGAKLVDPPAYRTVAVRPRALDRFLRSIDEGGMDAVAFLSPSSALGLAAALPSSTLAALAGKTLIASIGPTTSAARASLGARADVEAAERSARNLAEAIVGAVRRAGATP
jgi:uroporphyrinogen-III synthase